MQQQPQGILRIRMGSRLENPFAVSQSVHHLTLHKSSSLNGRLLNSSRRCYRRFLATTETTRLKLWLWTPGYRTFATYRFPLCEREHQGAPKTLLQQTTFQIEAFQITSSRTIQYRREWRPCSVRPLIPEEGKN